MKLILFITAVLSAVNTAAPAAEKSPFAPITFEQALERAAQQKKVVFIDFYTTWCGPCKIMDKTVFSDDRVISWLDKHTVAVKFDAEKNRPLADRFKVNSYPTLLFVKPDGTEIERLGGRLDAAAFLKDLERGLSTTDPLQRAAEKLAEAGANNPMARMDYAETLARLGTQEQALAEYLWCFDEGLEHDFGFAPMRHSMLLIRIADLGRTYPTALDALRARRDRARERILKGEGPTRVTARRLVEEFAGLNDALLTRKDTVVVFDEMLRTNPDAPAVPELSRHVFDELLNARRYSDILATRDMEAMIAEQAAMFAVRPEGLDDEISAQIDQYERSARQDLYAKHYEVLLGVGKNEEAATLARRALEVEPGAETLLKLAQHALHTNKPLPVNLEQAKTAYEMTAGRDAAIVEAYARLQYFFGKIDEACALLAKHAAGAVPGRDRDVLLSCAKLLKCPS